jgi:hypothetical protein
VINELQVKLLKYNNKCSTIQGEHLELRVDWIANKFCVVGYFDFEEFDGFSKN